MLREFSQLPSGLLDRTIEELEEFLGGPSLIHLQGQRDPALFISVLLHGNEHTGFLALQEILRQYLVPGDGLPRSLSVFIGNVAAARHNKRRLPGQPDYNRIWRGGDLPEAQMMLQVKDIMQQRGLFASIDIHNNTGMNPHYACIAKMDPRHMQLARLFRRTVVYFTKPSGTQAVVFSDLTPAITIECGLSDDVHGIQHVREFLEACFHLVEIPSHPVRPHELDLYRTVARIRIPDDLEFAFDDEAGAATTPIVLRADIDQLNFSELDAGTAVGQVRSNGPIRLLEEDPDGGSLPHGYLQYVDNRIVFKERLIPSMLTRSRSAIRDDCLGYLMKRKSY